MFLLKVDKWTIRGTGIATTSTRDKCQGTASVGPSETLFRFWGFSPCAIARFPITRSTRLLDHRMFFTADLNSITSIGHSGQLWIQQIIMSQPSTGCICIRKFRLSYSNSASSRWHLPGSISRITSQSGNPCCTCRIENPRSPATAPNSTPTPASFVGSKIIGVLAIGAPYTWRSLSFRACGQKVLHQHRRPCGRRCVLQVVRTDVQHIFPLDFQLCFAGEPHQPCRNVCPSAKMPDQRLGRVFSM